MRKNITIVILIGVLSWIPIVSQAQHHDDDDNSKVKLVKGEVEGNLVTFGLRDHNSYMVTCVEVLGKDSQPLFEFDNPVSDFTEFGISWFSIDLKGIKIKKNFYLRVHIAKRDGSNSDNTDRTSLSLFSISALSLNPIVPDETILIIKYP